MTETIREKLAFRFNALLSLDVAFSNIPIETLGEMAYKLADAAIEVANIVKVQPRTMDWGIAAGMSNQELADMGAKEQSEKDITNLYEEKMGYSSLPWYTDKKLERLLRFLLTKTPDEIKTFAEWSRRDFSSLNPMKARQYPNLVIECWNLAFHIEKCGSRPSILDEDESKFVPAPERK
jgi:hypothetical protein